MSRARRAPGNGVPAAGDAAPLGARQRRLCAGACRRSRRGARSAGARRARRSRARASSPSGRRACSRAASSSGSRSRAPGRCIRRCSSWTSRRRTSIPAATREIETVIKAFDAARNQDRDGHSQPRAGAPPGRRGHLSSTAGRVIERAPIDRFFAAPGDRRGRRIHERRAAMGLMLSRSARSLAARARSAQAQEQVHHRRLDHLDRAVGALQAPAADLREEDRHRGARRRGGHRSGARHRPARRRRRGVRARQAAGGEIHRRGPRREALRRHVQRLRR